MVEYSIVFGYGNVGVIVFYLQYGLFVEYCYCLLFDLQCDVCVVVCIEDGVVEQVVDQFLQLLGFVCDCYGFVFKVEVDVGFVGYGCQFQCDIVGQCVQVQWLELWCVVVVGFQV